MRKRALAVAVILFGGIALSSLGAEQILLDVDSAVQLARQNNLALQQARIDLGVRQRARDTAWNQFLPSLGAGVELGYAHPHVPLPSDPSPWDLSVSLSSSLPLSASQPYEVKAAALDYQTGLVAYEQTDKGLERDVRKSFYDLLLKGENIRLLEQSLETARKRYEQVSTNYEYGLVSELDRLNALVNLENLRPEIEKARAEHETAAMELKLELGVPRDAELELEGAIEGEALSLEAEELIRSYGSARLEVQSLLRELAALENKRKLTGAKEFSPALNVSYSYRLADFELGWGGELLAGPGALRISLSVPIDGVIPSSASRVLLADIDDEIRKANLELTAVQREGEITIETLVMNLRRSGLSIEVLKKNAELAQRVYELTEQEYEAGLTDLLTLEESYDDLQEARLKVLTEQHNYQSLLLDLEYELNVSLRD